MRRVVAVAALLIAVAACGKNQDPGVISPGSTTGGPTTTSHLLSSCPAGGPNTTTSPAGCLDANGKVVYP